MKIKKLVLAGLIAVPQLGLADYQFSINGNNSSVDIDETDVDAKDNNLSLDIYLEKIDNTKGPWAEAAFLAKTSSIGISYSDGTIESDFFDDIDLESRSISGRYVSPKNHFIYGLGYSRSEEDGLGASGDTELDVYSFTIGKYLDGKSSLAAMYSRIESDETNSVDFDQLVINYRNLFNLNNGNHLLFDGSIGRLDADDVDATTTYGLGATYFPMVQLGLGAKVEYIDEDDGDATTVGVEAEYFVTQAFSLNLSYSESEDDGIIDIEAEVLEIGFEGRF